VANIIRITDYGYDPPRNGVVTCDIGDGYELVRVGEQIQRGDEGFDEFGGYWMPFTLGVGMEIYNDSRPVRREKKRTYVVIPVSGSVKTSARGSESVKDDEGNRMMEFFFGKKK
jgi:hypothetical protein